MLGLAAALALSGCGSDGEDGAAGTNGSTSLVRLSTEVAGSNCAAGGTRIEVGVDADGDGVLDDAEVASTQFVCNGSSGNSGSSTLMSWVTEAAGSHCASGGLKVSSGSDSNANGVLDASEVTSTAYVCNGSTGTAGATGPSGADGAQALLRVSAEAAGTNCSSGGSKIEAGTDADADGVLDDAEVSSTAYVCNGSSSGSSTATTHVSLIAQATEAAGANCSAGGTKITSGLDSNDNGTLDASEVTATSYVCNAASSTTLSWTTVTGTSQQAAANTGYIASSASTVTITLPASADLQVGDLVAVSGAGSGGWVIAQNAGQSINAKNLGATAGSTWTAHGSSGSWQALASSSDGSKLVALYADSLNDEYRIYTSADSGATWTVRDSSLNNWWSVASSADGSKLVVAAYASNLYTSTDSGVTWTARESGRYWTSVASSSDGSKLVAGVSYGYLYTSTDSGASWTARATDAYRVWYAVASSSDGSKLVAAVNAGQLYTSTDSGATWTARDSSRNWYSVASSSDGTKLVAAVYGGYLYTSTDSGATWTARDSSRNWRSVASSSDGTKLVAAVSSGQLYTSTDSGVTWTARDASRNWWGVASSSDGSKLAATVNGGQIYTSSASTTLGTGGSLSGAQYDSVELMYLGSDIFMPISHEGTLTVQ